MHWTATEKSTTPSSFSALQGISVMRGAVAVSTCAVAVPCPLWSEVMLLLLPAMKLAPKKSSTTPVVAEHAGGDRSLLTSVADQRSPQVHSGWGLATSRAIRAVCGSWECRAWHCRNSAFSHAQANSCCLLHLNRNWHQCWRHCLPRQDVRLAPKSNPANEVFRAA